MVETNWKMCTAVSGGVYMEEVNTGKHKPRGRGEGRRQGRSEVA